MFGEGRLGFLDFG